MAYLTGNDFLEIARGNLDRLSHINKFGSLTTSDVGDDDDIWDGGDTYPFPTNTFATQTVQMNTPLANVFASATAQCVSVTGAVKATGTITLATVVAGQTVTFNGLVYTARSGAVASNSSFDISGTNTTGALSLAFAITNDSRVGTSALGVTASPSSAVVTITASVRGTGGNALTLVSSDGGTLAVSGAGTLTGGVVGHTVVINALTFTAVVGVKDDNTQFSVDTDNDTCAADLEDSINNDTRTGTLESVSGSATTNTVTLTSSELGTAGNPTTLTQTGGTIAISGATFTGGVTADVIVANGLTYTFVTGAAADFTEISVDTGNNAMATSFAAAITGDTREGTAGDLSASPSTDTVTLTTSVFGISGNAITLTSTAGGRVVLGGAIFSGGVFEVITKLSQTTNQAAMVGATIEVQGLDVDWNPVTQTKALDASNTTTPVTLDTPLIRVHRMRVLSNVVGDQPIRAHNTAESVDYAIISTGENQTLMAIYTVPAGYTAYMTNYDCDYVRTAAQDPNGISYRLSAADRANGYTFQVKHQKGIPSNAAGFRHQFEPYLVFTEKTDIKVSSKPEGFSAHTHASFDLILENNN